MTTIVSEIPRFEFGLPGGSDETAPKTTGGEETGDKYLDREAL